MEFQEHPDLRSQQRYYQQQEYPRYPDYSQYPEIEKADSYHHQEKVVPVDAQSLRSRYGNRPPYSSRPVQPAPMKNTVSLVPQPKSPTVPAFQPPMPSNVGTIADTCRRHNVVLCEKCINPPSETHHCQALITICQDCGQQHPVIADACQSSCKNNMPVSEGLLENQPVKVLRDSGCTTVVVRRSLVPEDRLTG